MVCAECGHSLTETQSDYVCPNCGLIAGPRVVDSSYHAGVTNIKGFNTQSAEEGERNSLVNRTGSFIDYYGRSRLTDIQGKNIDLENTSQFKRLKRINDVYTQSQDKARLYSLLKLLNSVSGVLELPESIKEEAAKIIRTNYSKVPHLKTGDLVAASIYLITRMNRYNLRLRDLMHAFLKEDLDVQGKNILYAVTKIRMVAGYHIRSTSSEEYLEKVIQALINDEEFISKLEKNHISNFEYGILLRKTSREIFEKLSKSLRGGRDPYILATATVAGADLVIASKFGNRRGFATQRLIARVSDVAEYTMREHFIKIIKKVLVDNYHSIDII